MALGGLVALVVALSSASTFAASPPAGGGAPVPVADPGPPDRHSATLYAQVGYASYGPVLGAALDVQVIEGLHAGAQLTVLGGVHEYGFVLVGGRLSYRVPLGSMHLAPVLGLAHVSVGQLDNEYADVVDQWSVSPLFGLQLAHQGSTLFGGFEALCAPVGVTEERAASADTVTREDRVLLPFGVMLVGGFVFGAPAE